MVISEASVRPASAPEMTPPISQICPENTPCLVGHLAFTHRQALRRIVTEYLGRGKQGAVHLLLAGHIGAHAADVGARLHPFRLDKRLAGRGGGEDHVAVPDGLLQIGRGGDSGMAAAAAGQQLLHLRCDGFAGGRRALRMVGVGHIDRLDLRQQVQCGGNEIGRQCAGTGHQQHLGVRPRQILCADRPRRAGAEVGDGTGVQQRPGRAGGQIEQQGRAVQGGQPLAGIGAEPRHHLQPVEAQSAQIAGLYVQIGVAGVEFVEHHGPQRRVALALFQICLLHGLHRHGDGQQLLDSHAVQYRHLCHDAFLL